MIASLQQITCPTSPILWVATPLPLVGAEPHTLWWVSCSDHLQHVPLPLPFPPPPQCLTDEREALLTLQDQAAGEITARLAVLSDREREIGSMKVSEETRGAVGQVGQDLWL